MQAILMTNYLMGRLGFVQERWAGCVIGLEECVTLLVTTILLRRCFMTLLVMMTRLHNQFLPQKQGGKEQEELEACSQEELAEGLVEA
jgi:hypothetical protein